MPELGISISSTVLVNSTVQNYKSYTLSNTPFYFKLLWSENSSNYSQYKIIWDFDDGTIIVGASASHYYKFPGEYQVRATIFDKQGNAYQLTNNQKLSVFNVMPDTLVFDRLPPSRLEGLYLLPAGKKSEPLKIFRYNSWQNDRKLSETGYTINLYASGSNSTYYSPEEYYSGKYSHLRNFFGFVEDTVFENTLNTKIIDKTTTTSVSVFATPIFDEFGEITFKITTTPDNTTAFAGTTGSSFSSNKKIIYIDQTPSGPKKNDLIFLYAHFDTVGFEDKFINRYNANSYLAPTVYGFNNTAWQAQYLKSVFNPASTIAITSNGITTEGNSDFIGPLSAQQISSFCIYPVKWTDSNISFCCTFKDSDNYTTKNYPPITGFRYDGQLPTELNSISLSLVKIKTRQPELSSIQLKNTSQNYDYERISNATFVKNNTVPQFKDSSYFCGLLKTDTAVNKVVISACALIQDSPILNLGITYGYAGQPGLNNIKRFSKKIAFDHRYSESLVFDIIRTDVSNIPTEHNSSVGISVLPFANFRKGQNRIYVTDADNDRLQIYTPESDLVGTINFRYAYVNTGANTLPLTANLLGDLVGSTPASIALDSTGSAWVSLYDAISCFKFDYNTLTITACACPPFKNELLDSSMYLDLYGYTGENTLTPASIDTDAEDNLVVGYSHPLSGLIVKYSSTGSYISHKILPRFTSIQEILIDRLNNIYVSVKNLKLNRTDPHLITDYLYKFTSDLELDRNFPISIKNIGRLTIDLNQNIYANSTSSMFVRVSPTGIVTTINMTIYPVTYMQYIGGIACDEEGFLWLLHNQTGKIYFYPTEPLVQYPLSAIFCGDLPDIEKSIPQGGQASYSVVGDWTGVRWINKYSKNNVVPRYISGTSNLFTILQNKPVVYKVNEDFDMSNTLKSYVLQESFSNKPDLFDNFVGQIVGDADSLPTDLGKTIYEKIANFVLNKSDIDVCDIDSLKSMFLMYGKTLEDFNINYPSKLSRVMNLLSIKHSKLFGSPNLFNRNFSRYDIEKNLGPEIDVLKGTFIPGEPIIAFEKFSEKYKLIYTTLVPTTDSITCVEGVPYPLSGVNYKWGWGLITQNNSDVGVAIGQFYKFYKYLPYMPQTSTGSIIDFNNELTTLTNTQSSYNTWTAYGGSMDVILSRALHEGLNLYD